MNAVVRRLEVTMPVERKAWACAWKCGCKVTTSRKRMEFHEARCFRNPARKACQTCAHHEMDSETVYNPDHGGNPGSTDYEVQIPYCDADETIDLRKGPRCDCPLWSNAGIERPMKPQEGRSE